MYPIFVLFGKEISMYAVMAVVGMLVSGFVFCARIRKCCFDDNDAVIFLVFAGIGVLAGGHALYGIVNAEQIPRLFKADSISAFFSVAGEIFGGSVFYGGLIGASAVGMIYIKKAKLPMNVYTDNSALLAPLFHGFARIGCFFGGCCYGIESKIGFCAHGNTLTAIGEVRRFPVQLLESALNFLIAFAICMILKSGKLRGRVFCIYLVMYSVVRFFDEFLRGDEIRGYVFGLSTSQFISILVLAFALIVLFAFPKSKGDRVSK